VLEMPALAQNRQYSGWAETAWIP